jgi:hypothetical protein
MAARGGLLDVMGCEEFKLYVSLQDWARNTTRPVTTFGQHVFRAAAKKFIINPTSVSSGLCSVRVKFCLETKNHNLII